MHGHLMIKLAEFIGLDADETYRATVTTALYGLGARTVDHTPGA